MGLWSLLLRVTLALALVLNGTSAAMAAVQMGSQMNPVSEAPAIAPQAGHACHGMDGAATQPGVPDQGVPKTPDSTAPDCCKSATCSCACVQGAQATTPVGISQAKAPHCDQPQMPRTTGHIAPVLPHLIRPPIG